MNAAGILAGGARLVRTQPKAVAFWGVLYLACMLAMLAMFGPMFGDLMALQQQQIAAKAAGLPPPPPPAGFFATIFGVNFVNLVLFATIFAASVRAVARGGTDRFGFLRFGGDELRLIGLAILLWLAAVIVFFLAIMAGAFIVAALAPVIGSGTYAVVAALVLGFVALAIWAQVRLSLAGVFTVLRGRMVVREAWRATRGRFWTLFGVYLLIVICFAIISIAMMALTNPGMFAAYAGGMHPRDMQTMALRQQAMMRDFMNGRMVVTMVVGAVLNAFFLAFSFGAVATAAIGFDHADRDETDFSEAP